MAIICRYISFFFIGLVLLGLPLIPQAQAATITQITYGETGSTVGTSVAANTADFSTFTPITAITAGSTVTITFPTGTTLNSSNIAASDFRIVQDISIPDLCVNAGADTAPSGISVNASNRTITFTVASGSLSTTAILVACGKGQVTIKTSATAGGNEIQHPTTATTTGTFAVSTSVGDSGSINNVTFVPDTATTMAFTTQPSSTATAGQDFGTQPVVTAYDQYGNVVTNNSSSQITIAAVLASDGTTAGGGTLNATSNPVTVSSGVATFAGVDYTKAEAIKLKATASGISQALSNTVTVSAAAPNKLAVQTQPSSTATAGQDFGTQPVFLVQDQFSNTVTSDNTTSVTIAAVLASDGTTAGGGTLNATSNPVTASSGIVTFASVDYTKAEAIKLKATSGGLTQVLTNTITVDPASASQLAFTTQPSSTATAGQDFGTQPVVTVRDAFGNTVTGSSASITLSAVLSSDGTTAGNGTLSATTNPLAASSGVATFAGVDYTKAESIKLKATSSGLSQALSNAITISAASAASLSKTSGDNQSRLTGQALNNPLVVTVVDAFSNPVQGTTVNFSITSTPVGASGQSLSSSSGSSNSSGQVSTTLTIGNTEGTYQVTAASAGLSSVVFTAEGVGYPTITSITPSTRGRNVQNQTLIISGTNFRTGATVTLSSNGVSLNSYTVDSTSQITLTIAITNSASLGSHAITITNEDASSVTNSSALTITNQPVISSISPNRLDPGESATITITGSNFVGSSVNFGGGISVLQTSVVSNTDLRVRVAVSASADRRTRSVLVTNSDGGISEPGAFLVASGLSIHNIVASPESDGVVTVTWTTSLPTTSTLRYGLSTDYDRKFEGVSKSTSHRVSVGGLSAGWVYHFRIEARDDFGQSATSSDSVFSPIIPAVLDIPVPRLPIAIPVTPAEPKSEPEEGPQETAYEPLFFSSFTVTLHGFDGKPLANTRVELRSTPKIAYTDSQGRATFPDVEPGKHQLIVDYRGVKFQQEIEVKASSEPGKIDEAAPIVVTLQPVPAVEQRLFWIFGGAALLTGLILGFGLQKRILR